MNAYLKIIILLLIILIIILVLISVGLSIILLKQINKNSLIKKGGKRKRIIPDDFTNVPPLYCSNHEKEEAVGTCAICELGFCKPCLKEHETLHFCLEHYHVFLNNKWSKISSIKTTPNDIRAAKHIYDFKKKIWQEKKIPSYIITHYKIRVEDDTVESYINLFVRDKDALSLKEQLDRARK